MATTNITVRIEDSLLDQVDIYCEKNKITRSDLIRNSLLEKLKEPELLQVSEADIKGKIEKSYKLLDINFETHKFIVAKGVKSISFSYELQDNNKQLIIKDAIGRIVQVISMLH